MSIEKALRMYILQTTYHMGGVSWFREDGCKNLVCEFYENIVC